MNPYIFPHEPHLTRAAMTDLMVLAHKTQANITFDIKYASTDNFTGQVVYPAARAFLLDEAAHALIDVARQLAQHGCGLRIFDAYRPWHVSAYFWTYYPQDRLYLADPNEGSRHNRGCAVDLSLYDLKTGQEVGMPSAYDEFNEKSHLSYMGGTATQNARRALLNQVMLAHQFACHPYEWWHFDFKNWQSYQVRDDDFASLDAE